MLLQFRLDKPKSSGGYNINWDEIDADSNPFAVGPGPGQCKLKKTPMAQRIPGMRRWVPILLFCFTAQDYE